MNELRFEFHVIKAFCCIFCDLIFNYAAWIYTIYLYKVNILYAKLPGTLLGCIKFKPFMYLFQLLHKVIYFCFIPFFLYLFPSLYIDTFVVSAPGMEVFTSEDYKFHNNNKNAGILEPFY